MAKVGITLLVALEDDGRQSYPIVLDVWDEFCIDSNYEGFQEKVRELEKDHGRVAQVISWYDDAEVMKVLGGAPVEGREGALEVHG